MLRLWLATHLAERCQWAGCKWTCVGQGLLDPSVHQSHSSTSSNWSSTEKERERARETETERWKEVMDDGKVWVSKLVNGCTVFIDFKKITRKRDVDKQIKTHMYTLTHLAILPILPRCSRSCKTVTCYRMSRLMCWIICHSAPLYCTINSSLHSDIISCRQHLQGVPHALCMWILKWSR